MVDVKIESDYLMAGLNVDHRDVLTIVSEAMYVMKDRRGQKEEVLEMRVRMPDGNEKLSTPNQTSVYAMVRAWGKKTEGWVGKKVAVKVERKSMFGEVKDIIYLVPLNVKSNNVKGEAAPDGEADPFEGLEEPPASAAGDKTGENGAESGDKLF